MKKSKRTYSPHQRWRQCGRKATFKDRVRAVRRAKRLGLRAYRCRVCNHWHLTSQDKGDV